MTTPTTQDKATLLLRLPTPLKNRLQEYVADRGVSANSWILSLIADALPAPQPQPRKGKKT